MELLGDKSKLNVIIVGKSNPSNLNEWDQKWITVKVKINLIGFTANYKTELLEDDLILFKDSLKSALNKSSDRVELNTLEESIYLEGQITYSGLIEWKGFVQYPIGDGNKLVFNFESDFSQIEKLYNTLDEHLKTK